MRALLAAALVLALGSAAVAQPPAPVSGFDPTKSAVSEDQLFRQLDRVTGRVSIPDRKAATLEQPAGQEWRDYHRALLPWLGVAFVLGMLALVCAYYVTHGRVRIDGGPAGRTIVRFGALERFVHWLAAASWCVLALSGLNIAFGRQLLLPLLGAQTFSAFSQFAKYAHNYLAFPFTLGIVLILVVWVRHNIPNRVDVEWFRRGGGLFGREHPPAQRFNGGQKITFWVTVLGGGAVAATGFALLLPFTVTDISGQQLAQIAHGVLALLMIAAMLAHIYIGSVGMEGAFGAMGSGQVDVNWAKTHHSLWLNAELQKQESAPAE
jgi:formate dehydrogenase subunit gamma